MTQHIRTTIDGPVATITIDRPAQHNAISFAMWQELREAASKAGNDESVRAVILTGAGGAAFSAGADIKDFPVHRSSTALARDYAVAFEGALDAVEHMPKPVIAMIRGICVGGGCELATACDLRIAATGSTFGVPVARIGVLVGYAEMRRLVRLVGPSNASNLLLTARMLDEQEALRMGLVNEVFEAHQLEEHTYKIAHRLATYAPLTQAGHKEIMRTVLAKPGLDDLTEAERELPLSIFDTDDAQEGYRAFMDKRAPRFTGR